MAANDISHLIEVYRYWILIPLAFIEGPVVAFVAGTFASLGYLNLYFIFLLFLMRDIIGDGASYAIGRYMETSRIARFYLKKIGVTKGGLASVQNLWAKHGARTMFISKLSYGLSIGFLMVAGMVRVPLVKYFKLAIVVSILQYGTLLLIGFFFGNAFSSLYAILENITYFIAAISLFAVFYYLSRGYIRRKLIEWKKE